MRHLLAAALCAVLFATAAQAVDFRVTIQNYSKDKEYYEFGLLELALSKADGDHQMVIVEPPESANQQRLISLLEEGNADFDIIFTGIDRERHARLRTVPIPLQRGLLGHRILIVSEQSAQRFAEVETMADLHGITIGSGTNWPDTEILEAAGFTVEKSSYHNLFKMVDKNRIPAYARAVSEPFAEIASRSGEMPNLRVDRHVMVVYPFDVFYFLNKQDQARYDILMQGLQRAYEDGSFMAYFESHPLVASVFAQAAIDDRLRFDIPNPLLPEEISAIPDMYWHGR